MKATIDGITYEGTEDEIRRIAENPPHSPHIRISHIQVTPLPFNDFPRNWDGSPRVTCSAGKEAK